MFASFHLLSTSFFIFSFCLPCLIFRSLMALFFSFFIHLIHRAFYFYSFFVFSLITRFYWFLFLSLIDLWPFFLSLFLSFFLSGFFCLLDFTFFLALFYFHSYSFFYFFLKIHFHFFSSKLLLSFLSCFPSLFSTDTLSFFSTFSFFLHYKAYLIPFSFGLILFPSF